MDNLEIMPKINGLWDIFSTAHTRNISIVATTQSTEQLIKKYDEKAAGSIFENIHCTMVGLCSPNSTLTRQNTHRFMVQVDGKDPFITKFNLRFKWGIGLEQDYTVETVLPQSINCTNFHELENKL